MPFAVVWWDCFNFEQNWPRGVSFDFRSLIFMSSFSALIHLVGFFARAGFVFALVSGISAFSFCFSLFCRVPLCCLLDKDTPPCSLLSLSHVEQKLSKMFGSQGLFICCFRDYFFSCFMARSFVESKQRPFRDGTVDTPVRWANHV